MLGNFELIFSCRVDIVHSISSGVFVSRSLHPTLISMQCRGPFILSITRLTDLMFPVFSYCTFSVHQRGVSKGYDFRFLF